MTVFRSRVVVSILAALMATSFSSAAAQEFDHLECYQVKDPLRLRGPKPAWLDLTSVGGATDHCRIVGGFRLYCVPVRKEVTAPIERKLDGGYAPFTPLPFDGVPEQSRICYRIRCTDAEPPGGVLSDQFGTRAVDKAKPFLLCGPAVEGECDAVCGGVCTDAQTDPENCGACGNVCSADNASSSCVSGACQLTCNSGFDDCDLNPSNGCETDLEVAVEHCGACGNSCPAGGGTPACVSGVCEVTSCVPGFGDCDLNSSNGCETDLGTVTDCGACGNSCTNANGTASCVAGACQAICTPGFGDCDLNSSNGCETALGTVTDCGACGNACPAETFCSTGVCVAVP